MSFINTDYITATIASGSETASGIDLFGRQLVGIIPAGSLSGTQLYFNVKVNQGDSWKKLYSGGAWYSATVAPGVWNYLDDGIFKGVTFVQFDMTATAPSAAVGITALVRPIA